MRNRGSWWSCRSTGLKRGVLGLGRGRKWPVHRYFEKEVRIGGGQDFTFSLSARSPPVSRHAYLRLVTALSLRSSALAQSFSEYGHWYVRRGYRETWCRLCNPGLAARLPDRTEQSIHPSPAFGWPFQWSPLPECVPVCVVRGILEFVRGRQVFVVL